MKLWASFYAMIWLVFAEFMVAMTPERWQGAWLTGVHAVLGFGILVLAFVNFSKLRETTAPGRIKRTAGSTRQLAVAMAVLGPLLAFDVGGSWGIAGFTVLGALLFVHVLVGFAIITQAAATAIAFDMWEEKEWMVESEAGVVPPMPLPERGAASGRGNARV